VIELGGIADVEWLTAGVARCTPERVALVQDRLAAATATAIREYAGLMAYAAQLDPEVMGRRLAFERVVADPGYDGPGFHCSLRR
jgi:hypothetical protein